MDNDPSVDSSVMPRKLGSKKYKQSRPMKFFSDFANNCSASSCAGWSTSGKYFTYTSAAGKHSLSISMTIKAPVALKPGKIS